MYLRSISLPKFTQHFVVPPFLMDLASHRSSFLATLYDNCVAFQAARSELVIFSPIAGEFVVVAW